MSTMTVLPLIDSGEVLHMFYDKFIDIHEPVSIYLKG